MVASDDFKERLLVMRSINVPAALPLAGDMRDVAVENIELVGTTGEGVVRVRNIAFKQCIAVRFTLDKRQRTSEVTTRYMPVESLPKWHHGPLYDHNQTGQTLFPAWRRPSISFLVVRYSVSGREIWDNNSGRNYHVQIVREKVPKANKETVVEKPQESSHANDFADLRRQLEQVVKPGRPSETVGSIRAQHSRLRWESLS